MPLRRFMTQHGLPSWYSWIAVVMLPIMASIAVLVVSLRVNERSVDRERAAREQAQEQTNQILCSAFAPVDDGFRAAPPTSTSGKTLATNIATARRLVCH